MKLLLFDIDGTLLISKGAGRKAMQAAVRRLTNRHEVAIDGIDFSGRTDPQIIKDVFLQNGLDESEWDARIPEVLDTYVTEFESAYHPDQFIPLPGVQDLVKQLDQTPNVQLAILTGNLQKTAYLKLQAIGLDQYFPFGAFASDDADRYKLPNIAVKRAFAHNQHAFKGKNVVIIGDTRHDILCGRDIDVFTVAVSTGHYSAEDLHIHEPDVLFDDLSDADAFMSQVILHKVSILNN